jgi:hypothetical protein
MKTLIGFSLAATFVGLAACAVEDDAAPRDIDRLTKDEARALGGKADGIDVCDWLGWYGDGICDPWCPQPDPDCGPAPTCASLGGQCLRSPIDVTFAASCEADYGMVAVNATCEAINLSCCIEGDDGADDDEEDDDAPGDGAGCVTAGGQCLSSPIDFLFAADCEAEFDMISGDEDCGAVNLTCCHPADGGTDDGAEPTTCEQAGGQCFSSPLDVTFGADCEGEFGLHTIDAECEALNQSCCK